MTNYYNDRKNAEEYISMAEGYDGQQLIEILKKYLPRGSTLLELGMGPGKDLKLLNQYYQVTGSDYAQTFLDIYREVDSTADLLLLDATTLKTDRKFAGIYSNKVLHHLSEEQLKISLARQKHLLNPGGVLLHSFWYGEQEEFFHGLRFRYYNEDVLIQLVEPHYKVLEMGSYKEMEDDDSLFLVLQSR